MKTVAVNKADEVPGNSWAETRSSMNASDVKLRAFGFKINSRHKGCEATWVRNNDARIYGQGAALEIVQREICAAARK